MTTPPTPAPPVTPPIPDPGPIPPVQPDNAGWWQWLLGMILSLAIGVGVLIGHPFHSDVITAVIPSVSIIAASLMAAFGVHGQTQVKLASLNLARAQADEHAAHMRLLVALGSPTTVAGSGPSSARPAVPSGTRSRRTPPSGK